MYEDLTTTTVDEYEKQLADRDPLAIHDLVNALPVAFDVTHPIQKFRIQVLAAAAENQSLARNLRAVMKDRHQRWQESIRGLQARLAPGQRFEERVYWAVLFDYMPYASSFLDDEALTPDEYRTFLADKLQAQR